MAATSFAANTLANVSVYLLQQQQQLIRSWGEPDETILCKRTPQQKTFRCMGRSGTHRKTSFAQVLSAASSSTNKFARCVCDGIQADAGESRERSRKALIFGPSPVLVPATPPLAESTGPAACSSTCLRTTGCGRSGERKRDGYCWKHVLLKQVVICNQFTKEEEGPSFSAGDTKQRYASADQA